MKLEKLLETLGRIAPLELAESWDNVGLLAGDPSQTIRNVMLTIDMTSEVFAEAKAKKVDLIIAYHPPLFESIKKVVAGVGPAPLIYDAVRSGIAIYSMHTALDMAAGGINDVLAEIIGIDSPQPLQQCEPEIDKMCKLIVFVPTGDLARVSEAIFSAGAGNIDPAGRYSKCSFRSNGTGTFQCGPASNPTIGSPGSFEQVDEIRLESIVPRQKLNEVINAMLKAHSYEEAAYDIIPILENSRHGLGRWGNLKKPATAPDLIERIKKRLHVKTVGVIGPGRGKVKKAAAAAGSCGTLLREVIHKGCDFYLTGELKHHHALELQAAGVTTVCVSHSNSERIILKRIAKTVKSQHNSLHVSVSRKDRDPFTWR